MTTSEILFCIGVLIVVDAIAIHSLACLTAILFVFPWFAKEIHIHHEIGIDADASTSPPPTGSVVLEPGERSSKGSRKVKTRDGQLTITPPEIEVPYTEFPLLTIGKPPDTKTVSGTWITFDEVLQAWRVPSIPNAPDGAPLFPDWTIGKPPPEDVTWKFVGEYVSPKYPTHPYYPPRIRHRTYRTVIDVGRNTLWKFNPPSLPDEEGIFWVKTNELRTPYHSGTSCRWLSITQVWQACMKPKDKL